MNGNTTYAEGSVLTAGNLAVRTSFAIVRMIDLYKFQTEYEVPLLRERFSQIREDARTNLWHLGTFENLKIDCARGALAVLEAGLAMRQAKEVDAVYPVLARELAHYALGIHDEIPTIDWHGGISLIKTVLADEGIRRADIRGWRMRKYDQFLHELAPEKLPQGQLGKPVKYLEMRVAGA